MGKQEVKGTSVLGRVAHRNDDQQLSMPIIAEGEMPFAPPSHVVPASKVEATRSEARIRQLEDLLHGLVAACSDDACLCDRPEMLVVNDAFVDASSPMTRRMKEERVLRAARHVVACWQRLAECEDEFGHYAGFCSAAESDVDTALVTLQSAVADLGQTHLIERVPCADTAHPNLPSIASP